MSQGKTQRNALTRASLGLWLALTGCAHQAVGAKADATNGGAELSSQVASLQQQVEQRDQVVRQLENRLALLEAEQRQLRQALAEQRATALGVRETVRISEQAEDGQNERQSRRSEPRPVLRLYEDKRVRNSEEELAPIPEVSERLPIAPLPELHAARADADPYRTALELLKRRDFVGALASLDTFLAQSPTDAKVGRALFWRGEVLFAQKRYEPALQAFQSSFAREPEGEKAADALLKIGLCHKRLGAPERARAAMNQLKSKFPDSQAARLAQAEEA